MRLRFAKQWKVAISEPSSDNASLVQPSNLLSNNASPEQNVATNGDLLICSDQLDFTRRQVQIDVAQNVLWSS